MSDFYMPDDHELDALLEQPPQFDLNAVKCHTLSRIDTGKTPSAKRRSLLRYLLIAAVICALSATTLATDYAMGGPITRTLGLRKPAEIQLPPPVEESQPPAAASVPQSNPEPQSAPEPPEPPEMDRQVASALQISESQAQSLRPALQTVEQTAEDQDVRMTVLQTLGDPYCLYVKLRFDFPEATPAHADLEFDEMDVSLEGADGYRWEWTVLERDTQSITYLLHIQLSGEPSLNGLTATVSVKDYGTPHRYTEDEVLQMAGEDGVSYTTILYPDKTVVRDPSDEVLASLPPESEPLILVPEGFTVSCRTDGSKVVTYDGQHGDQMFEAYLVPDFDAVIQGQWEQSWTISYQDLSRYWEGEVTLSDPHTTLTGIRLSPLSWDMQVTIRELAGEELGFGRMYDRVTSVQLLHEDGTLTEAPVRPNSASGDQTLEGEYMITTVRQGSSFPQPVDLSDVIGVVIEGREYLLSPAP